VCVLCVNMCVCVCVSVCCASVREYLFVSRVCEKLRVIICVCLSGL